MKFEWFPEELDSEVSGYVKKFLKKGLKKEKELQEKVKSFIKKVRETTNLQPFFDAEMILPIFGEMKGLYEMRIPPQRKQGVVRIYFCYAEGKDNTLVLLDAELKKDKEGHYDKAVSNMKRYLIFKGVHYGK